MFEVSITSNGKKLARTVQIRSAEVRKELDRIPEASVVVLDGDPATGTFPISDSGFFTPGKQVVISIRDGDDPEVKLFTGLVVRQTVRSDSEGTELHVELRDAAVAMTRRRRSLVLFNVTDADVYRRLLGRSKLKVGKIEGGAVKHPQIVQYYASDWDFMLSRADVNGQIVLVDDGEVSILPMSTAPQKKIEIEWGIDSGELELELDGTSQFSEITGSAWDPAQAAASTAQGKPLKPTAGDSDPGALAGKFGDAVYDLVSPGAATEAELKPWASARLARSRLALIRGRLVVDGRADIKPCDGVALARVGDRFNGTLLVSAVTHTISDGDWSTELQLGLSPDWFSRKPDIADAPAGGLLPPATTLHVGVVTGSTDDPEKEFRVRVELPGLGPEKQAVWARLARPDAGKQCGFHWFPEPGDEVVVGFFAGDPRQAVVLGALFGSKSPPPLELADGNHHRAIVSRAGTRIAFDDEKKSLTIATPGGHQIVLTDESGAQAITLADSNGSTFKLDKDGITMKSSKDVTIEASGKVVIKGSAVDIQ